MEDTYIIDLFWRRDENAIQLVDKSIIPLVILLRGRFL